MDPEDVRRRVSFAVSVAIFDGYLSLPSRMSESLRSQ